MMLKECYLASEFPPFLDEPPRQVVFLKVPLVGVFQTFFASCEKKGWKFVFDRRKFSCSTEERSPSRGGGGRGAEGGGGGGEGTVTERRPLTRDVIDAFNNLWLLFFFFFRPPGFLVIKIQVLL